MRVLSLGGGPAGLYLAILLKHADPRHDVRVVERNRPDDTFGWGVVFSDQTLGNLEAADPETAREIAGAFNHWDDIDVHFRGRTVTSGGHGFCGIGRKRLLNILQARCEALGVELRFETDVTDDEAAAREFGADLVIASDGLNSRVRTQLRRDLPARHRHAPLPLRLAGHEEAVRGLHVRLREDRRTAGSRRTRTSTTATRRPSSSRRPRRSGSARGSRRCRRRRASRSASGCSRRTSTGSR